MFLSVLVILGIILCVRRMFSTSDLILWFTFIAIIWYSYETFKLRKATERQNKYFVSPMIVVDIKYNYIKLKNVGNGPAIEISIDCRELGEEYRVYAPYLLGRESEETLCIINVPMNTLECCYYSNFKDFFKKLHIQKITLNVSYLDIFRNRYSSQIEIDFISDTVKLLKYETI